MSLTRNETFDQLDRMGISKVLVSFSGGNDEGGADNFEAHYTDGRTPVNLGAGDAQQDWESKDWFVWSYEGRQATKRPATSEEILHAQLTEALEQPVYDTYGGFGGDFHVYGTVIWDVPTRTAKMETNESSYTSHSVDF